VNLKRQLGRKRLDNAISPALRIAEG